MNEKRLRFKFCSLLGLSLTLIGGFSETVWAGKKKGHNLCRSVIVVKKTEIPLKQLERSSNLSQVLRSNVVAYWSYAKNKHPKELKPYLSYTGFVMGDPHFGNMLPMLIGKHRHWVNADFDDGGEAPFIFDIALYLIDAKAVWDELKIKRMLKGYRAGLRGEELEMPERLQELLDYSKRDYKKRMQRYLDRHTENRRFIPVEDELVLLPRRTAKQKQNYQRLADQLQQQYHQDVQVLDIAEIFKDRGGSADEQRLWALMLDSSKMFITEYKQLSEPAVAAYQEQLLNPSQRIRWLKMYYWPPDIKDASYDVVKLNDQWFYQRPKQVRVLDIPYKVNSRKEEKLLEDLAFYDAYYLGLAHGRQMDGMALSQVIEEDPEKFRTSLRQFVWQYFAAIRR